MNWFLMHLDIFVIFEDVLACFLETKAQIRKSCYESFDNDVIKTVYKFQVDRINSHGVSINAHCILHFETRVKSRFRLDLKTLGLKRSRR